MKSVQLSVTYTKKRSLSIRNYKPRMKDPRRERIPKKVRGIRNEAILSSVRQENKYRLIKQLHIKLEFSVVLLCDIASISRAAYYKWNNRSISTREAENQAILPVMLEIYTDDGRIFGYRRLTMHLNDKLKSKMNYKRIYRLMKLLGIQ